MDTKSDILKAALGTNMKLAHEGHSSWYASLERLFKNANLEYLKCMADKVELANQINEVKGKLQAGFDKVWEGDKLKFQREGKLELFASLMGKFGYSKYLSEVKNPYHRIALARMRTSAHKFPIESGRYDKIPRTERECPLGCKEVGDEYHYMNTCLHPFISDIIRAANGKIGNLDKEFVNLNAKDKLNYTLNHEDPRILSVVAKFCYNIQETYRDLAL